MYCVLRKKFWAVATLFLMSIVLSACFHTVGTSGTASEKGEFAKGEIVKGFGANVPLYKEAQVIETYGSEDNYGGAFISEDSLSRVLKFYEEVLPKLGWEAERQSQSETNHVFDIRNQEYRGSVIVNVAADGKSTAITIAVSKR